MIYESVQCASCGVWFGMDPFVRAKRKEDGGSFYCTNGHCLSYKGEMDELRRQRDRLKQENARLEEERLEAVRAEARAKAEANRLRKRAAAGTCPECKRTFPELAKHMAHRHPEFVEENRAKRGRPPKAPLMLEHHK